MRAATLTSLVAAMWCCAPGVVRAHGRPPFIGDIAFHPTDPDVIVARATFGLVLSEDGGVSWRWICAVVTGADPTREDPPILVTPDGAILVGTFNGLGRSDAEHCEFSQPEALAGRYIIDLYARPLAPEVVFAVATSGGDDDEIFRSDDQGQTFTRVGQPIPDVLVERVRVAPSDATRIYLSGAVPLGVNPPMDGGAPDAGPTTTPRRAFFLRSNDAGETFESIELPLLDGERNVHLLAVDPTDPERVLVRMTRRIIDEGDERVLLTEDGGDSWATVLMARRISGGAFTDDGTKAFVTSRLLDGLFRSVDAGLTFAQLHRLSLPCLELRGDDVYVCEDELTDEYAIGHSTDSGQTLSEVLRFSQIYDVVDCPSCTTVGHVCPMWFPDVASDLRLDAGNAAGVDGGTGRPRDAGATPSCTAMDGGVDAGPETPPPAGCGCRVSGAPTTPQGRFALLGPFGGMLLALALWARRGRG